jgi:UDP-3-O-[3-hydroxymyristoyl] N-acetylglucosamine deacetylase / 3-hydroxyacyl-[acyl-carrier-protein] dehydratase
MFMKQTTIKQSVQFSGVGLHTGIFVNVSLKPAIANHGYKFQRIDIENKPIIAADAFKVVSTNRGTTIQQEDVKISTVEHLLSALVGAGVDNVLIELDGPEIPIMDGTASKFVSEIERVGLDVLEVEREYFVIDEPIFYKDEATGSELVAMPADEFSVTTLIDFNSNILGPQFASLNCLSDYKSEIAPCRTFVFLHELEHLIDQGLIKGGDLENAIVLVDKKIEEDQLEQLAKKLNKPYVKVEKEGVLNTSSLKFNNEPARHKLLDVIGDLALVGKPIKGRIIATKPGHTSNIAFAKILKKYIQDNRKVLGKPKYNPDIDPIMDTVAIQKKLPHRYPFLMVDKIIEMSEQRVVGVKNVTFNEQLFQGHFPDNPVFPGVLQIEAMAQTGGILALANVPDDEKWDTYFIKIDSAKFKHKILPGDTLLITMELIEPIRRGLVHMKGTIYVGNKIASEADMTAQIVKRS